MEGPSAYVLLLLVNEERTGLAYNMEGGRQNQKEAMELPETDTVNFSR